MMTTPGVAADPALEQLLSVLALFKGAVTVGVLLLVRWRMRHPISGRLRLAYASCALALVVATVLLTMRVALGAVPILFDGGIVSLVLLGLTDAHLMALLTRRFPNPDAVRVRPPRVVRRMAAITALVHSPSMFFRRLRS